MRAGTNKTIFRRLTAKGFTPRHVAEVGVYHPDMSNVYDYVLQGVRCTLVEPEPESIRRIRACFGARANVTLHPVAAYKTCGPLRLTKREASTFVSDLAQSPAIANDGCAPGTGTEITVDAVTFDRLDDGTIDLLSVDIEGSEWFVIQHLVSRPAVISVETHGGAYRNPHLSEIRDWMQREGYVLWYQDNSDSVYVRRAEISLTLVDAVRLHASRCRLALRCARKRLVVAVRSRPARKHRSN